MLRSRPGFSSPRVVRRRRKVLVRRVGFGLGAILLFVALLGAAARIPTFIISNIAVSGASTVSALELEAFVAQGLSGNHLFLFPKSHDLFYPKETIETNILRDFPRIVEARFRLESLDRVHLTVKEREPVALYCGEAQAQPQNGSCYFLDGEGFIFGKAPDFSGNIFLRFFGGREATSTPMVGSRLLTADEFKRLRVFILSLEDILEESDMPEAASINDEGDVAILLLSGGKILTTRTQNFVGVQQNLASVLSSDEFQKKNLATLEYLDLRFGNKIYFKWKK